MTYQIDIPTGKTKEVLAVLKALGVEVKPATDVDVPNEETVKAINELRAGKGKSFQNVGELFNS